MLFTNPEIYFYKENRKLYVFSPQSRNILQISNNLLNKIKQKQFEKLTKKEKDLLKGKMTIEKLNVEKLKKLIDENKFLIVEVRPAFIKNAPLNLFHKIVLDGYSKKGFHVLDPSGEEHIVDFDVFLMAFYGAMPEVLIIKKA